VNYTPNRFGAPKPATEAEGGFVHFPEAVAGVKERILGPKFAEHYHQATLFYNSLTPFEKEQLTEAFSFELGKVEDSGVKERMLAVLSNVEPELVRKIAHNIGLPAPAVPAGFKNHGKSSPAVSQLQGPYVVKGSIKTRKVAFLIADGFDGAQLTAITTAVKGAGGIPVIVGTRRGPTKSATGEIVEANFSLLAAKSTLFDSVFVVGGADSIKTLSHNGSAIGFVNEAYKHLKAVGAVAEGVDFLKNVCTLSGAKFATQKGEVLSALGVVTGDTVLGSTAAAASNVVGNTVAGFVAGAVGSGGLAGAFIAAVGEHRAIGRDVSMVPV